MKPLVLADPAIEYTFLTLVFEGGALGDPIGREGMLGLAANTALCGTSKRTRKEFQERLDLLGADCTVRVGKLHTIVEAECLSRNIEELVELVEEVICEPRFSEDEFETQRNLALAELRQVKDSDEELAAFFHGQFVWQGHPYGRSSRGEESSLKQVTAEEAHQTWKKSCQGGPILIGAAGQVRDLDLQELQTRLGATHSPADLEYPTRHTNENWEGVEVLLIDRRDRTQAQVLWGQPICNALHDDMYALRLANTAFGGTFTSTLMQEIREKRGWTYGAYSSLSADRTTGMFSMNYHVENQNAADAIELGWDLFQSWRRDGLSPEDLTDARSYVVNSFPFTLETAQKRLEVQLGCSLLGRPPGYLETFVSRMQQVESAEINAALQAHLSGTRMRLTVLGNGKELAPKLESLPWISAVNVIPYDQPIGATLPYFARS